MHSLRTRPPAFRLFVAVLAGATALAGCTDGSTAATDDTVRDDGGEATATEAPRTGRCDDTDPTACLLPWPSDAYTRADASTATGIRVDLPADGTPRNAAGAHIDPAEWNRNDGFSPAAIPTVVISGVDPEVSALPPATDIGASLSPDSSLVLVDLDTGDRVPAWAESDPSVIDPERRPLRIVPAVALAEGHRHAVGLWDLRTADGTALKPSEAFAALLAAPDDRQQEWLDALEVAGRPVDELVMAWSFTVASTESLTARLRHMWSETASGLGVGADGDTEGAGAPTFTVDSVEVGGSIRIVAGSFEMPNYLTADGGPGSFFDNDDDPDGLPTATGTMPAEFLCVVPNGASEPAPFVIYGHGLLGSRAEVLDIGALGASAAGIGFCALDFIGMSAADLPVVVEQFQDLSIFRTQADRLQQGHLGFALLGRLLASPDGFVTDSAFQSPDGVPLVRHDALSFLGASQGGILGGASTAISPDWNRAIYAVGGMGYNLLLRRSINFDDFEVPFAQYYPDELDQAIALELIQELWQRGENAGWAQHLTRDPFPESGGPSTVLLLQAFGDHQVANVSTEKLARTLDIPRVAPTLAEGRSTDEEPFFGIPEIPSLPHAGSGLLVWDFGSAAPPTGNTPPREGADPHGKLANVPEALALVLAFIQPDGEIIDVCGGRPCSSEG